jgi:hypothetical protein
MSKNNNKNKKGKNPPAQKAQQKKKQQGQIHMLETKSSQTGLRPGVASVGSLVSNNPSFPKVYTRIAAYNEGKDTGIKLSSSGVIFIALQRNDTKQMGVWNTIVDNSTEIAISSSPAAVHIPINPQTIMPRNTPGVICKNYARFKFRKLRFTWVGTRTTSADEILQLGYDADGASLVVSPDYNGIVSLFPMGITPVWSSMSIDCSDFLSQKDWFYTDTTEVDSQASFRQVLQGAVTFGFNRLVGIAGGLITQGYLFCESEIDMIQPYPPGSSVPPGDGFVEKLLAKKKVAPEALESKSQ